MRAIRAVLFDLGGTLWEYRPGLTIEGVLASAAPGAIALLPPAEQAPLTPMAVAVAVRRAYLDLEHAAADGDTSPVPAELCVIRGLATLGVTVAPDLARTILEALYVPESRTSHLLPDVDALLRTLFERGQRLGIISNRMHGGTLLLDDLRYFGISHYFLSMVASCDAGRMKPHPLLYQRALAELGVAADEAVMVGDDLLADVRGARAAGLRAIWVRRPPDRRESAPADVPAVTGMAAVLDALDSLD